MGQIRNISTPAMARAKVKVATGLARYYWKQFMASGDVRWKTESKKQYDLVKFWKPYTV